MTRRVRVVENLDYRVLGAVRFVDAGTGQPVERPLEVEAPGVRWIRNRRNLHVVADAPGMSALTGQFVVSDPAPDPVTVTATVRDPARRYLARSFSFDLPRDADPANADEPASLFQPVAVPLYPSPSAAAVAGWAALRASVVDDEGGAPVEGALIRVVRPGVDPADDEVLARGLSDERGEAFVPIPGIPLMTWSDEESAVLADSVSLRIEAYADPAAPRPVDPHTLEADRATLPFDELASVPVKAGASVTATLRLRPRTP